MTFQDLINLLFYLEDLTAERFLEVLNNAYFDTCFIDVANYNSTRALLRNVLRELESRC